MITPVSTAMSARLLGHPLRPPVSARRRRLRSRRLRGRRPPRRGRPAAGPVVDRGPDGAAGLQARAHADAQPAAGGLRVELAVAAGLARLLQGPARRSRSAISSPFGSRSPTRRRSTIRPAARARRRKASAPRTCSASKPKASSSCRTARSSTRSSTPIRTRPRPAPARSGAPSSSSPTWPRW